MNEVGKINGMGYLLSRYRICDIFPLLSLRSWKYFLWMEGEYIGFFETKKEAYRIIKETEVLSRSSSFTWLPYE